MGQERRRCMPYWSKPASGGVLGYDNRLTWSVGRRIKTTHVGRERPSVKRKKEPSMSSSAFALTLPAPQTGAASGQESVLPAHDLEGRSEPRHPCPGPAATFCHEHALGRSWSRRTRTLRRVLVRGNRYQLGTFCSSMVQAAPSNSDCLWRSMASSRRC